MARKAELFAMALGAEKTSSPSTAPPQVTKRRSRRSRESAARSGCVIAIEGDTHISQLVEHVIHIRRTH